MKCIFIENGGVLLEKEDQLLPEELALEYIEGADAHETAKNKTFDGQ